MKQEFKVTLEERTSKKTGNKYECIVIKLSEKNEKLVFLDEAQLELLKMTLSKQSSYVK